MMRYVPLVLVSMLAMTFGLLSAFGSRQFLWGVAATLPLALVGIADMVQRRHSLLRNYPLIGHVRFFFEGIGPELRQYFFASDTEEEPFNREQKI